MSQLLVVVAKTLLCVILWKQGLAFISPGATTVLSLGLDNQHHHPCYYNPMKDNNIRSFIIKSSSNEDIHCNSRMSQDGLDLICSNVIQQIMNGTLDEDDGPLQFARETTTATATASNRLIEFNSMILNKLQTMDSNHNTHQTYQLHPNGSLVQIVLQTTHNLRLLMNHYGPSRGQGRKTLIELVHGSKLNSSSNALGVILIVSALALNPNTKHDSELDHDIAISRAIVSGILPQEGRKGGTISSLTPTLALNAVHSLLNMVLVKDNEIIHTHVSIDLHIVTSLARSFIHDTKPLSCICASVIRQKLNLKQQGADSVYEVSHLQEYNNKSDITGALGLAAQLAPWSDISPIPLVEVAILNNLWHAAERLCDSAITSKSSDTQEVVQTLIEGASERHLYRVMDTYATTYYDNGGKVRFAEARLMHACDTIAKVVIKRQYPIIEKQVERVDFAYSKVKNEHVVFDLDRDGPREVRDFAIEKLMELNEHDAAHRLATLWGFDFIYNERDAEKYAKARKEKYLQFNYAFPNSSEDIPEPIACPNLLHKSLTTLKMSIPSSSPVIGFDVEWGEEKGASLLQLSTMSTAILIDIPALLESEQGCDALDLVGQLFQETHSIVMVGFSCSEDISRLKASVGVRAKPWLTSTTAVVDIKPLITLDEPSLKHAGLSKVCNIYLSKPLDKSEQCSLWARRPLTILQRVYAVLDAWAVVAIWNRIRSDITDPLLPNIPLKQI